MIFSGSRNGLSHISMLLNGLPEFRVHHADEEDFIIKTQTRRWSSKRLIPELYQYYTIGQLYAIQPGRTKPGLEGVKIKLTRKWIETTDCQRTLIDIWGLCKERGVPSEAFGIADDTIFQKIPISAEDALAEGGYTVKEYETVFRDLNPKWDGLHRVGLEFRVMRV